MTSIFETKEWEEFKLKTGYQKSYRIEDILVLQKNLPFGRTMFYSPMVSESSKAAIKSSAFLKEINKIGVENKAIFYRLELDILVASSQTTSKPSFPTSLGFKKSFEEMQPEHTIVLDLEQTEEELLSEMKQKCRYNIKVAQKNGVVIRKSLDPKDLDIFYDLYSKTGKRHDITHRGKDYFKALLEILGKSGYAQLYTATTKVEGKDKNLASAIMIDFDQTVIYMFGASSDECKNLMAPHLLHWQAIQDAKCAGYKKYDFFGIAATDDANHPWAGITRFKKQFGGEQVNILGSYDLPLRPIEYQLFKIAEKIRR